MNTCIYSEDWSILFTFFNLPIALETSGTDVTLYTFTAAYCHHAVAVTKEKLQEENKMLPAAAAGPENSIVFFSF